MKTIQQIASSSSSAATGGVAPPLSAPTLIERSGSWSRPVTVAVIGGLSLLSFLLGIAALYLTPAGTTAAIWWPAAGVSALIYLLYRGPRWQVYALVGAVGLLSNVVVGRPMSFAVVGAIILVIELAVFVRVLGPQNAGALLSTMRGLSRFLLAVAAASLTIGLEGALTIWWLAGSAPLPSFLALLPSHASALLLIVPIALVPLPHRVGGPVVGRIVEGVVQLTLTVALAAVIFSPTLPVPMLFTLFPLFAWAASRFAPAFVVVELIVVAAIVPTLTVISGGPFGEAFGYAAPGPIVQLFMLSAAITTLFLAAVRSERELLAEEKERRAALMRGGFLGAQVGFLVLRQAPGEPLQVLEANATATEIIDRGWLTDVVGDWMDAPVGDLNRELMLPDGRSWQVFGSVVPSPRTERIAGIQLVDVSDHVAARDAMAHAIDRERAVAENLRDLARQKDDFVSAVSHELRTPITSIIGFAEDLDDSVAGEHRTYTEVIIRNSNRLAGMVEQLLELGRMTAPNPVRSAGVVDLNRVVAETAQDQCHTSTAVDVTVETSFAEDDPLVTGDDNSLGRIVTNLLSNALKFTPPGGTIRLATAVEAGHALVTVDDSGVGISHDDREHVFERFYRSNDDAKLVAPGTGLGLAIVRSLVELLGGTIEIDDSPLGGARFVVRLPLAEPSPETTDRPSAAPGAEPDAV